MCPLCEQSEHLPPLLEVPYVPVVDGASREPGDKYTILTFEGACFASITSYLRHGKPASHLMLKGAVEVAGFL